MKTRFIYMYEYMNESMCKYKLFKNMRLIGISLNSLLNSYRAAYRENKIMHCICFVNGRGVLSHFYRLFSVIDVIDVAQRTNSLLSSSSYNFSTLPYREFVLEIRNTENHLLFGHDGWLVY